MQRDLGVEKFNNWYSWQISKQLDEGKLLYAIDVLLKLSLLKHVYAEWMVEL